MPTLITEGVKVTGTLVEAGTGKPVQDRRVSVHRTDDHLTIGCEGEELANAKTNDKGSFELMLPDRHGEPFDPREVYGDWPSLNIAADTEDYTSNGQCVSLDKYGFWANIPQEGGDIQRDVLPINLGKIELQKFVFDYVFKGTIKTTGPSGSLDGVPAGMNVTVRIVPGPDRSMDPRLSEYAKEEYSTDANGNWRIELKNMGHEPFDIYFEARDDRNRYFASSHYAAPGAQDRHPQQPNPVFTRRYSPVQSRGGGRIAGFSAGGTGSGVSNIEEKIRTPDIQVPPLILVYNFPVANSQDRIERIVGSCSDIKPDTPGSFEEPIRGYFVDEMWDQVRYVVTVPDGSNEQTSADNADVLRLAVGAPGGETAQVSAVDPLSGEQAPPISIVCNCN